MTLTRWEPLREMGSLQREMNRLFDTFGLTTDGLGNALSHSKFMPAAELNETDEAIDLKIELPGLKPDDIDLQVAADTVTISGERKSEVTSEKDGVTRSEFHYGSFHRVVPLPSRIKNDSVNAEYTDGILRLHMPKVEEERNRVVKVSLS
jgi:HSP20 family protein